MHGKTIKQDKLNKEIEKRIHQNRKMFVTQKTTEHTTYRREPFIKKVFGEIREFANRKEYKDFYRQNRRRKNIIK